MLYTRRMPAALGGLAVLVLTSCVDSGPVGPDGLEVPSPSASILTGTAGVWFLPPLVESPSLTGTFNPNLRPAMSVCQLDASLTQCVAGPPTASFPSGSFAVSTSPEQYQLNWDTNGPETAPIDASGFYRLSILVGGQVVAFLDLDPQLPGPGQSSCSQVVAGFCYAFQLGETIPVKLWGNTQVLCPAGALECQSATFDNQDGGQITLDQQGDVISVLQPPNAIPGADAVFIVVTRLSGECFPFDAPVIQGGNACLSIEAYPPLQGPLLALSLISLCLDQAELPVDSEAYTLVRWATDGSNAYEALENVPGACPTQIGGLLDVPERGLLRFAALGVNAVARFLGPAPVLAHGTLNLGSLTGSYSHFGFAHLGQMIPLAGDGMVFPVGAAPADASVVIGVEDFDGGRVPDACMQFSTTDGATNGTATDKEVCSDANGEAAITWNVDTSSPGQKTLTVSGLGLFEAPVQDHDHSFSFAEESITITATVCVPGSGDGTATIDGSFGSSEWGCAASYPFMANISGGSTPAVAYWMNDADNLYLAVRVQQTSTDKANSLRFDFDSDGDGLTEANDDIIGYDAVSGSFLDQYLTDKCVNSSQSGCGSPDAVAHGAGAATNAAGWTTYELSHPLTGGGVQDLSRAAGQQVGAFWTLRIGSGAQGNTQVPGFRQYQQITIR